MSDKMTPRYQDLERFSLDELQDMVIELKLATERKAERLTYYELRAMLTLDIAGIPSQAAPLTEKGMKAADILWTCPGYSVLEVTSSVMDKDRFEYKNEALLMPTLQQVLMWEKCVSVGLNSKYRACVLCHLLTASRAYLGWTDRLPTQIL